MQLGKSQQKSVVQKENKIKLAIKDRVYYFIVGLMLTLITFIMIYPLYFVLIASISDPNMVNAGRVLLYPQALMFDGYRRVFNYVQIWVAYRNTIMYLVLGTTLSVVLTLTGGYALSRKDLRGRPFIMIILTITMFFQGGMIPRYLLVRSLGLIDTIFALILPNAVSVWNLIIARTFFAANIPDELLEASKIDGCGDLKFFFTIVLPLSSAVTMVMILFYGVGIWNGYFDAMIFLKSTALQPLQLVLRDILLVNQSQTTMMSDVREMVERQKTAELLKYVIIIISSVPLLIVYPFLQKYFEKGVMIGAIKG